MDVISPQARSRIMASIHGRDTSPEMAVRSIAHGLGLRFRLHGRGLAGTPDLVFPRHGAVIFVHGCFWHHHSCHRGTMPKTRIKFWKTKLRATQERDRRSRASLRRQGWRVLTIWECETRHPEILRVRIARFFRMRR
jgi:DNA mismatch endonuclease (patch repair protein)